MKVKQMPLGKQTTKKGEDRQWCDPFCSRAKRKTEKSWARREKKQENTKDESKLKDTRGHGSEIKGKFKERTKLTPDPGLSVDRESGGRASPSS